MFNYILLTTLITAIVIAPESSFIKFIVGTIPGFIVGLSAGLFVGTVSFIAGLASSDDIKKLLVTANGLDSKDPKAQDTGAITFSAKFSVGETPEDTTVLKKFVVPQDSTSSSPKKLAYESENSEVAAFKARDVELRQASIDQAPIASDFH